MVYSVERHGWTDPNVHRTACRPLECEWKSGEEIARQPGIGRHVGLDNKTFSWKRILYRFWWDPTRCVSVIAPLNGGNFKKL